MFRRIQNHTHSNIYYSGHFVLDEKAIYKPQGGFQVVVDNFAWTVPWSRQACLLNQPVFIVIVIVIVIGRFLGLGKPSLFIQP